jgi:hypothetical protein
MALFALDVDNREDISWRIGNYMNVLGVDFRQARRPAQFFTIPGSICLNGIG